MTFSFRPTPTFNDGAIPLSPGVFPRFVRRWIECLRIMDS